MAKTPCVSHDEGPARALRDGRSFDIDFLNVRFGRAADFPVVDEAVPRKAFEIGEDGIIGNGEFDRESVTLPVFGKIADSGADGVDRGFYFQLVPVFIDIAALDRIGPEDQPGGFGSPGAHEACESEDFAFSEIELSFISPPW